MLDEAENTFEVGDYLTQNEFFTKGSFLPIISLKSNTKYSKSVLPPLQVRCKSLPNPIQLSEPKAEEKRRYSEGRTEY